MIDKILEYIEYEYEYAKNTLEKNYSWCTPQEIIRNAETRAFGAVSFINYAQHELFPKLEPIWEAWRKRFESLYDEINTQC